MIALHWRLPIAAALLLGIGAAAVWGPLDAESRAYAWGLVTALGALVLDMLRAADARRRSSRPPRPPSDDAGDDSTPTLCPPGRPRRPWLPLLALACVGCGASVLELQQRAAVSAHAATEAADETVLAIGSRQARDCTDLHGETPARDDCLRRIGVELGAVADTIDATRAAIRAWAFALLAAEDGDADPGAAWAIATDAYARMTWAMAELGVHVPEMGP